MLDCAVGPLVERLHDLDTQLYVQWNPKKLRGWGCWEVRRKPNLKTVKDVVVFEGNTYVDIDYVENNFENHILDIAFLNYDVITRLKKMDLWEQGFLGKDFGAEVEKREEQHKEKTKAQALKERSYEIRQHKSMVRDLMDYTLSGGDPSQIANYWPKG